MVDKGQLDPKVQNFFRIHHIASFVEGEHSLKPEEVVRHLKALHASKRIEETPCIVKLDARGIKIKLEKTKETVESFEWCGIKNQAAVLNPMDIFQYKYLVLFRLYQAKEKVSELHVFSCESTFVAKSFVDSLSYHKNRNIKEGISDLDGSLQPPLRRGRSETKVNTVVDAYGQHFYMLNRCIDDIESFERRLEKAIKSRASPKEGDIADNSRHNVPKAPSTGEFTEAVRKVKYAFNTNEAIRPYTPDRTSKKIFIRLFNTVHWLDEVCKSGCMPEYNPEMVSDVVEPLLNEDTIRAIMERLAPKKQEFWRSLGKAWNTPSEQWPNPCNRYMPQFDTPATDGKPKHLSGYEKPNQLNTAFRSPSLGAVNQSDSPKIQFRHPQAPYRLSYDNHSNGSSSYRLTQQSYDQIPQLPESQARPNTFIERTVSTRQKSPDTDRRSTMVTNISETKPPATQSTPPPPQPASEQSVPIISSYSPVDRTGQKSPLITANSPPASPIPTSDIIIDVASKQSVNREVEVETFEKEPTHSTRSAAPTSLQTSFTHRDGSPNKPQTFSGEPYIVTIRHVSAKAREISVSPGTVVDVLDKSKVDWWLVRDPHGSEGEIPKWKLKQYRGNQQDPFNRQPTFGSPGPYSRNQYNLKSSSLDAPVTSITLTSALNRSPTTASSHSSRTPVVSSVVRKTASLPPPSEGDAMHDPAANHVASYSMSPNRSEKRLSLTREDTTEREQERVISVNKRNEPPPVPEHSYSTNFTSTSQQTGPTNNMLYMTSDQLQEIMKSSESLSQVPMVLVPVSELYKYASRSSLDVNAVNGNSTQSIAAIPTVPMQWPDLNELRDQPFSPGIINVPGTMSEWKPAPLVPTGSLEGIGFSPYPFNYPTHTHTMTRELRERLSKMREGGGSGLKAVPIPTTSNEKSYGRLTKYATKDEIAEWLVARQFSPKVISNLRGFNGMDLYTMSRQQLAEHVGPERCDEIFYAFRGT